VLAHRRQEGNAALLTALSTNVKGTAMNLPIETKPALWGLAGGAAALAIVGFTWGGWMTGAKAEAAATQRSGAAVVAALAPICVDNFRRAGDATANLVALKKVESWSQGDYVEKGGWAKTSSTIPPEQVSAVAKACAGLLTAG